MARATLKQQERQWSHTASKMIAGLSVSGEVNLRVSNDIEVNCYQLSFAEIIEDKGFIHSYPIGDGQYQLVLNYLISGNGKPATIYELKFYPAFFTGINHNLLHAGVPFSFDTTTEEAFPVCNRANDLLRNFDNKGTQLTDTLKRMQSAIALLAI
ncbi:MAG: hypothetical protein EBZ77_15190, partial [Chitinophagia bacterium]|nr:hypothetical protein [Chitinophagia bacterium]